MPLLSKKENDLLATIGELQELVKQKSAAKHWSSKDIREKIEALETIMKRPRGDYGSTETKDRARVKEAQRILKSIATRKELYEAQQKKYQQYEQNKKMGKQLFVAQQKKRQHYEQLKEVKQTKKTQETKETKEKHGYLATRMPMSNTDLINKMIAMKELFKASMDDPGSLEAWGEQRVGEEYINQKNATKVKEFSKGLMKALGADIPPPQKPWPDSLTEWEKSGWPNTDSREKYMKNMEKHEEQVMKIFNTFHSAVHSLLFDDKKEKLLQFFKDYPEVSQFMKNRIDILKDASTSFLIFDSSVKLEPIKDDKENMGLRQGPQPAQSLGAALQSGQIGKEKSEVAWYKIGEAKPTHSIKAKKLTEKMQQNKTLKEKYPDGLQILRENLIKKLQASEKTKETNEKDRSQRKQQLGYLGVGSYARVVGFEQLRKLTKDFSKLLKITLPSVGFIHYPVINENFSNASVCITCNNTPEEMEKTKVALTKYLGKAGTHWRQSGPNRDKQMEFDILNIEALRLGITMLEKDIQRPGNMPSP